MADVDGRTAAQTAPPALVAVVGRPNVGKSTLVNRLIGRRAAITEERPGVTRDRTEHDTMWSGRPLTFVDTGGWTGTGVDAVDHLGAKVTAQAEQASLDADVVLFVVDATVGITTDDAMVARWLRDVSAPVLLVANKADALGDPVALQVQLADLYGLGMGDPHPVSALHGRGSGDLLDAVVDHLADRQPVVRRRPADEISVVLLGRPNVGKSSLFNRLAGQQRAIVDERPGTTRDAIDSLVRLHGGGTYRFVDTAGLRRKGRQGDPTEYYSRLRTVDALHRAQVALLVLDAAEPFGEQEQRLGRQVIDAGRGLVMILNKWDIVDEDRREWIDRELDRLLAFTSFAPLLRTSAVTGRGLRNLGPVIDQVHVEWSRRVPTAAVNRWLADAVAATAPPMIRGRAVRLRYATQVEVGPPTFRVFTTGTVPASYLRYLERSLRDEFGFIGTPVRIGIRVRQDRRRQR
ncbi:MAG: ribosome biogenesis GTPase Der [Actinobacteria bacterium]|nr:ribosome biogenesis GTPase Der [Actinomycetota bacterium]